MIPYLFLDIDGVLNRNDDSPVLIDQMCVSNLNLILREIKPTVILSSAWRYMILRGWMTSEGFRQLLISHGVSGEIKIVGTTDRDPTEDELHPTIPASRGLLISKAVQDFGAVNYVVIDDYDDRIRHCGHRLVLTDPHAGLTTADAKLAIEMFIQKAGGK